MEGLVRRGFHLALKSSMRKFHPRDGALQLPEHDLLLQQRVPFLKLIADHLEQISDEVVAGLKRIQSLECFLDFQRYLRFP